jgi:hypothetical protein
MFLHLTMTFMNFFSVMIAQCALFNIYNSNGICHAVQNLDYHSLSLNWMFLQFCIFYCNFLSMLIFLLLSRIFKFRTLREKAGLGGNLRNTTDFLEFCQDDVHWITFQVTQVFVILIVKLMRQTCAHNTVKDPTWLFIPIFLRWMAQGIFLFIVYYTKRYPRKREVIALVIVALTCTVIIWIVQIDIEI